MRVPTLIKLTRYGRTGWRDIEGVEGGRAPAYFPLVKRKVAHFGWRASRPERAFGVDTRVSNSAFYRRSRALGGKAPPVSDGLSRKHQRVLSVYQCCHFQPGNLSLSIGSGEFRVAWPCRIPNALWLWMTKDKACTSVVALQVRHMCFEEDTDYGTKRFH